MSADPLQALTLAAQRAGVDMDVPLSDVLDDLEAADALEVSVRALNALDRWLERVPDLTLYEALTTRPPRSGWSKDGTASLHRIAADWIDLVSGATSASLETLPSRPTEHAEPTPLALPPTLTDATLRAWGTRHQVLPYLVASVGAFGFYVPDEVRRELNRVGHLSVLDLLLMGARLPVKPVAVEGVIQSLVDVAGQVDLAVQEEETLERRTPEHPALREMWSRLVAARPALREGTHPVRRRFRGQFDVSPRADAEVLRVTARGGVQCGRGHVEMELPILVDDGDPVIRCRCGGRTSTCVTRLAALDRVLDELEAPTSSISRRAIEVLSVPAWSRALARLAEDLPPPDGADGALGWRLLHGVDGWIPEPVTFRLTKDGSRYVLTKAPPARTFARAASPRDRAALTAHEELSRSYGLSRGPTLARALGSLVDHPHVFVEREPVTVVVAPWTIAIDADDAGGASICVRTDGRETGPAEFLRDIGPIRADLAVVHDGERKRLSLYEVDPLARNVLEGLARAPARFPPEGVEPLVQLSERWRDQVPVQVATALKGTRVPPSERLEVRLAVPAPGVLRVAMRVRPVPGGAAVAPGQGPLEPMGWSDGARVHAVRDPDAEIARHRRAWEGLPGEPRTDADIDDPEVALSWLERLPDLPDVDVTWDGTKRWRVSPASARHVSLTARDARSWFTLDGTLAVDTDAVPLSVLLAAVRERRTFVPLGKERWARVTEGLRAHIRALARGADTLSLSSIDLPFLDAMVKDGARVAGGAALAGSLERFRCAEQTEITVPEGLRATLRPYQIDGVRFIARLAHWAPGAVLADDMGLGKTLQALALLLDRASQGPALVIAPTSVGFNWTREAERFAPGLRVRSWRGPARRALLADLAPGDVLVTSYDLAQRDARVLAAIPFATLVLDEAQALKNAATQRWKAVRSLQRSFTLALTGTPIENRLEELWALTALVVPGLFGDAKDFRAAWSIPIERDGAADLREALSRRIRPFLLRRTKAAVAPELPDRTVVDVIVELEPDEQRVYDEVRKGALVEIDAHTELDTAGQSRIRVLAALTALRRVACHPALHDPSWRGATSKLDRVRELIAELRGEGQKALVFSQFVGHLALVRRALEADGLVICYLDGSTPEATRRAEVDRFQAGEADVFLISLKAGGTGLNLTAASYVFHLDPWWNPAVEDQATDRAHRIGQTRAVTVYRLAAAGTVEQQILAMHESKRSLVAGVLEGTDAGARLGLDDLLALLRGEANVG